MLLITARENRELQAQARAAVPVEKCWKVKSWSGLRSHGRDRNRAWPGRRAAPGQCVSANALGRAAGARVGAARASREK